MKFDELSTRYRTVMLISEQVNKYNKLYSEAEKAAMKERAKTEKVLTIIDELSTPALKREKQSYIS